MIRYSVFAAMLAFAVASPGMPQPASAQTQQTLTATEFINRAAMSNLFEIQSSKLVIDKGGNVSADVKQFAQRMMQDHTNASAKLKGIAKEKNIPEKLDETHAQMLQELTNASGQELARTYMTMQVQAHRDAISLFERYAQGGDDAELKAFAQQTLPALREHLELAQKVQSSIS